MDDRLKMHLEAVDAERRAAILKLVRGAAFAVPMVASFALDGRMSVASAGSNLSSSAVNT